MGQQQERQLLEQPNWCFFEGVTCGTNSLSTSFNRVVDINLRNLGLIGFLPTSIENFNVMTSFDLGRNSIQSTIPSSIITLTLLTELNLDYNFLSGTIPSTIFKLDSLSQLRLNSNFLTMGLASSVSTSTFAVATRNGFLNLTSNCLAYEDTVTATHCRAHPTSRK